MSSTKKPKKLNKNTFAKGCLRRGSLMWRPISECRRLARKGPNSYECALCKGLFTSKQTQVDHRQPIVDMKKGFTTFDEYIDRLFCDVDELDLLCTTCHDAKSASETQMRKYFRNKRKEEKLGISNEEEDEE